MHWRAQAPLNQSYPQHRISVRGEPYMSEVYLSEFGMVARPRLSRAICDRPSHFPATHQHGGLRAERMHPGACFLQQLRGESCC